MSSNARKVENTERREQPSAQTSPNKPIPAKTDGPALIGQPQTMHCACGCRRNVERRRVVAVSMTKDGKLEAVLGYVETLGCGAHVAHARTAQGLQTAFLHPSKVRKQPVGTLAAQVLAETHAYVQPQDQAHYYIA